MGNADTGAGTQAGQGLSHDGGMLVLALTPGPPYAAPSKFLVVDTYRLRAVRTIVLHGYFSFDALSPGASRMYLIEFEPAQAGDAEPLHRRGYDMR